jgi:hypothetical protein
MNSSLFWLVYFYSKSRAVTSMHSNGAFIFIRFFTSAIAFNMSLIPQPIAQLIAPRNIERVADAGYGIPIGRSRSKPCAKPEKSPRKRRKL